MDPSLLVLRKAGPFGVEAVCDVAGNRMGKILAPEHRITGARPDLHYPVEHFDDRDIERPAAKIEDNEIPLALAVVEPVGQRGSRGLVDQAGAGQSGELLRTSILPRSSRVALLTDTATNSSVPQRVHAKGGTLR